MEHHPFFRHRSQHLRHVQLVDGVKFKNVFRFCAGITVFAMYAGKRKGGADLWRQGH